jgi:hypothetical protein
MTQEKSARRGGWDPVFLHSRREALVIFAVWLAALAWAVPFCYLTGYGAGGAPATVLGIPSWAFWGIATPWILANVFTVWFCFRFMEDDPLEASAADPEQGS